jgi:hypothetical protein
MGWFRNFMDGAAYAMYGVDTKKARQERAARRNKPGPIARGLAIGGVIGAVGTSASGPQQSDTTTQRQWGDSTLREQGGGSRGRSARGATRDQGNRTGGSGQGH